VLTVTFGGRSCGAELNDCRSLVVGGFDDAADAAPSGLVSR
jgi:hypothetical protein